MTTQPEELRTDELLREISALQDIQKSCQNTREEAWQMASEDLAPLFREMARRQEAGLL